MNRSRSWLGRSLVVATLTALIGCATTPTNESDDESDLWRSARFSPLKRAIWLDPRLVVLTRDGELLVLTADGGKPRRIEFSEPVLDICRSSRGAAILTGPKGDTGSWTLRELRGSDWTVSATLPAGADKPIAMFCTTSGVVLITERRLLELGPARASETELSQRFSEFSVAAAHLAADSVLVGLDYGEFGGGLWSIDRRTGQADPVWRCDASHRDEHCDPVTGIAHTPDGSCIAIATGIAHLATLRGRVVEMCPTVRALLQVPLPFPSPSETQRYAIGGSVPFYDLARSAGALWMLGIDGIRRIDAARSVSKLPPMRFKSFGEFEANFELDEIVVVRSTDLRNGTAQATLLVPR